MQIISNTKEMASLKATPGCTRALVPTMGNLHQGHLALIKEAHEKADEVIVSIYVNPTQFGPKEDFAKYPRTLERDIEKLEKAGTHILFTPEFTELYPYGLEEFTYVHCPSLDKHLCSQSRPMFFKGVATVVTKLLNITQAELAVFGEKDYQQLAIIKRICDELFIRTKIISVPTVRETSGLALSSRNQYLTQQELKIAPLLYKTLNQARMEITRKPEKTSESQYLASLEEHAKIALVEYGFDVDYFNILDSNDLQASASTSLIIAAAVIIGNTRLIDNIQIDLKKY